MVFSGFVISSTDTQVSYSGCVSSVIFSNPDSDYSVLLLRQADDDLILRDHCDCEVGDYINVNGVWADHPVHKNNLRLINTVI